MDHSESSPIHMLEHVQSGKSVEEINIYTSSHQLVETASNPHNGYHVFFVFEDEISVEFEEIVDKSGVIS